MNHALMKVFKTSPMSPDVWKAFTDTIGDQFIEDGYMEHEIGGFVKEAKQAAIDDPEEKYGGYVGVEQCELLDAYLIANGGVDGEVVLVYHG